MVPPACWPGLEEGNPRLIHDHGGVVYCMCNRGARIIKKSGGEDNCGHVNRPMNDVGGSKNRGKRTKAVSRHFCEEKCHVVVTGRYRGGMMKKIEFDAPKIIRQAYKRTKCMR
jgi:hypothetical protein